MEFIFHEDYQSMKVSMYLKVRNGERAEIIGYKDGNLVAQVLDPYKLSLEPLIPLLQMNRDMAFSFLKAVSDYASGVGVKNENENLLKGKLLATEKHLEDLRTQFPKVLDKLLSS
jgi:hypothetical protein